MYLYSRLTTRASCAAVSASGSFGFSTFSPAVLSKEVKSPSVTLRSAPATYSSKPDADSFSRPAPPLPASMSRKDMTNDGSATGCCVRWSTRSIARSVAEPPATLIETKWLPTRLLTRSPRVEALRNLEFGV